MHFRTGGVWVDKRERISVQLLGGFSMSRIAADGTEYRITEQDSTSRRLWAFLEYMSLFYDRPVSQDEIVEALWGDTDLDPSNTMKTLLHRARSAMEDRLGLENGKDVIQYRREFIPGDRTSSWSWTRSGLTPTATKERRTWRRP